MIHHNRRKCVLPARRSEQDPARTDIWKIVEGGNRCSQGLHGSGQYRCDHISGKRKQAEETLDTVHLEELPDSRERAGALVLWASCEGQIDVWEMFSDNSYLSAILDR